MPDLFPLPLTATEEFYLVQEMIMVLELIFEGEVNREAFNVGLFQALQRHPLLSALMERRTLRAPRWVYTESVHPRVTWTAGWSATELADGETIDLTAEVGVRFHVQVENGRSRMIVAIHHACCDAFGALQFLSDLFIGYVRHLSPDSSDVPPYRKIDPERLRRRNEFALHVPAGISRWRFARRVVGMVVGLLAHPATVLAVPESDSRTRRSSTFSGTLTRTLDEHVYRGLRRLARQKGVTVNDLYIREMFLVQRDWNRMQAPQAPLGRLAQMIPTNMRNLNHDGIPATNVMSCSYCNRHVDDCDDPEQLLHSVHEEQVFVKESRFPATLVFWLRLIRKVPGLLRWMTVHGSSFATVVLTNVGDPWRVARADWPSTSDGCAIFGNLVLTEVNSAAAMPAQTRAAFTVWQAGERLRIAVRCDGRMYSRDDAQSLLDLFVRRVVNLVELQPESFEGKTAA